MFSCLLYMIIFICLVKHISFFCLYFYLFITVYMVNKASCLVKGCYNNDTETTERIAACAMLYSVTTHY